MSRAAGVEALGFTMWYSPRESIALEHCNGGWPPQKKGGAFMGTWLKIAAESVHIEKQTNRNHGEACVLCCMSASISV